MLLLTTKCSSDMHISFCPYSKQYVPDISGGVSYFGVPPASRAPQRPAAAAGGGGGFPNAWGRGNTLGH